MMIHRECDVEVNAAVDNLGGAVLVCPGCGRIWTAEFTLRHPEGQLMEGSDHRKRVPLLRAIHPDWFPA